MKCILVYSAFALALSAILQGCGKASLTELCPGDQQASQEVYQNNTGLDTARIVVEAVWPRYSETHGKNHAQATPVTSALQISRWSPPNGSIFLRRLDGAEDKDDKDEAKEKAEKAADVIKGLGETVHDIVQNKQVNVKNVLSILETFAVFIPEGGPIIGAVLSVIKMFLPGETDPVMEKLNEMKSQLDSIQSEMSEWFSALLGKLELESCKNRYFETESKIRQAHDALVLYRQNPNQNTKTNFLGVCSAGMVCQQRVRDLLNTLNGDGGFFGCDLMQVIYNGADNDFFTGSTRHFSAKVGYLMILAANGLQVEAAFQTLQNQDTCAFKSVSKTLGSLLSQASRRMKSMLALAAADGPTNLGNGVDSYFSRNGHKSNKELGDGMLATIVDNFPDYATTVIVTKDLNGYDHHCRTWATGAAPYIKQLWHQQGKNVEVYFIPSDGVQCDAAALKNIQLYGGNACKGGRWTSATWSEWNSDHYWTMYNGICYSWSYEPNRGFWLFLAWYLTGQERVGTPDKLGTNNVSADAASWIKPINELAAADTAYETGGNLNTAGKDSGMALPNVSFTPLSAHFV